MLIDAYHSIEFHDLEEASYRRVSFYTHARRIFFFCHQFWSVVGWNVTKFLDTSLDINLNLCQGHHWAHYIYSWFCDAARNSIFPNCTLLTWTTTTYRLDLFVFSWRYDVALFCLFSVWTFTGTDSCKLNFHPHKNLKILNCSRSSRHSRSIVLSTHYHFFILTRRDPPVDPCN